MLPIVRIFFAGLCWAAVPAQAAGVYFSNQSILKDFFSQSEKVSYVWVESAPLRQQLGYAPAKARYAVYVARSGEGVDGYAVIDDERGQHLPISFAVKVSPEGAVQRVEVLAYREDYGEEIRNPRFRQQFVGASPKQEAEVVAISGATISSRSMAVAVKRAVALVELARQAAP